MKVTKRRKIIIALLTVVIVIVIIAMYWYSESNPKAEIRDGQIQIKCLYGLNIPCSDIKSISLIDKSFGKIEPDAHRDNGYSGFGGTLKGHFSSDGLGQFMLFVKSDLSPTIWIDRISGEDIYFNLNSAETTEALYHQLSGAITS